MRRTIKHLIAALSAATALWVTMANVAGAHCDTMDGPVVADARIALEKGNIAPVLKWVKPEGEMEVTEAFSRALAVRAGGNDARELADLYFFETLVRVHRAGEGAPYTGLKPAGTEIDPAIMASDVALEKGEVEPLIKEITAEVEKGVRERYERAAQARAHAEHNTEAGRQYVEAYVEFMHYMERLHTAATTDAAHQLESGIENNVHKH